MPMGAKGSTRHLKSSGDTCCVRRAGGTSHSPSRAKAALALTHVLILTVLLHQQERRQPEHGESGA
ncbi:hypothetical protein HDV62DRAFT_377309 [Trichoderma sp. SZMC 28011]